MLFILKNTRFIKNAWLAALSLIIVGCSSTHNSLKSQPVLTKSQLIELPNAQVVASFPEPNPSSRFYVNNRGTFKAYKGRGQLLIQNHSAESADIYINNQKLISLKSFPRPIN